MHIHSCLSPCGDLSASPRAIAACARKAGLDMAALTDHNTARNAPAFEAACRAEGVVPLFGMEVTTVEEIHVLTLFASAGDAVKFGDEIYNSLNSGAFDPESFGDQIWVNSEEEIEGSLDKLLILGTADMTLDELGPWCHSRGGLIIPAHINRPSFSVLGQLGFLPQGPFDGVECTEPLERTITEPWTVTASSDAHFPEHTGKRRILVESETISFEGLRKALAAGRVTPVF